MTSKTFKSAVSDLELCVIRSNEGNMRVLVDSCARNHAAIDLAPSEAPALALAVLEAAGYGEEVVTDGSPDGHVQVAKYYLHEGVKAHERASAEARERAELEAEALELHNAFWAGLEEKQLDSWDDERGNAKNSWVSAARRAREMRTEK